MASTPIKKVAVVGGGISGLSAACCLTKAQRAGAAVEPWLFEASDRLGGSLRTESVEGCLIEAGADSFLTEKSEGRDFCRELGIEDRLIGSNDHQRRTWVVLKGRLAPLPAGIEFIIPAKLLPLAFTPMFTWAEKFRILSEVFNRRRPPEGDESVAAFIERHFGRTMLEVLVDPMLNGVYGADTRRLSVRAVLPRLVAMEKRWGSLLLGIIAARRRRGSARKDGSSPPIFSALRGGFTEMVDAARSKLEASRVLTNCPVEKIEKVGGRHLLRFKGRDPMEFDSVILAQPAWAAGELLSGIDRELGELLRGIPYASSMVVALVFDRTADRTADRDGLRGIPEGFGFLVPRREGKRLRACTFVGQKFSHRVPDDKVMLRCFLGGMTDEPILSLGDEEVLALVRQELRDILSLDAVPIGSRIFRWRRAMAQYPVGHLERLEAIEGRLKAHAGLYLAGNGYRGIGVPDCIRSGREAAEACLPATAGKP